MSDERPTSDTSPGTVRMPPAATDGERRSNAAPAPVRRSWFSRRRMEFVIGAGVLFISALSLVVAVNANRTQERILAASVWPSLIFGTGDITPEGEEAVTLDLLNRGIGPARIRWAELSYDGTPVRGLRELLRLCCGYEGETKNIITGLRHRVMSREEWLRIVYLPKEGNDPVLWERFEKARHKVRFRACYCSVLDQCWLLDSEVDEPEEVEQCPAPGGVLWGM